MEVRLRLQRSGKTAQKHYNYRIVAISRKTGRDARHLDIIGHYAPAKKPEEIVIDDSKLEKWLKNGAQMSDTVKSLVKKHRRQTKQSS